MTTPAVANYPGSGTLLGSLIFWPVDPLASRDTSSRWEGRRWYTPECTQNHWHLQQHKTVWIRSRNRLFTIAGPDFYSFRSEITCCPSSFSRVTVAEPERVEMVRSNIIVLNFWSLISFISAAKTTQKQEALKHPEVEKYFCITVCIFLFSSVVDPDPHRSRTFAWIQIRN